MNIYVNSEKKKLWNELLEFFTSLQRKQIYSDIEWLIEQTALEKGISPAESNPEFKGLVKDIANQYVQTIHGWAVFYLLDNPEAKEVPVVEFTYEELFRPANPREGD